MEWNVRIGSMFPRLVIGERVRIRFRAKMVDV